MSAIRNIKRMAQCIEYEGMVFGKCKPTDIDQSIDFQGNVFIFSEFKFGLSGLTPGQKYHLQHLVKAVNKGGKQAYAVLVTHDTPVEELISSYNSRVVMYYDGNGWTRPSRETTHYEWMKEIHDEYQAEKERKSGG
jgi:hypothetical protein